MKKLLVIFMTLILCFSFTACKNEPDIPDNPVNNDVKVTVNPATLAKLKNSTPEETASTFLRALCENDYDLFLLVSNLTDSVEAKDRFQSMSKGYDGKNYTDIPVTLSSASDTTVESEQYDENGDKVVFGNDKIGKRDAVLKIFLTKDEDGNFYFKELKKDL